MSNPLKQAQFEGARRAIHEFGCRDTSEVATVMKQAGLEKDPEVVASLQKLDELTGAKG